MERKVLISFWPGLHSSALLGTTTDVWCTGLLFHRSSPTLAVEPTKMTVILGPASGPQLNLPPGATASHLAWRPCVASWPLTPLLNAFMGAMRNSKFFFLPCEGFRRLRLVHFLVTWITIKTPALFVREPPHIFPQPRHHRDPWVEWLCWGNQLLSHGKVGRPAHAANFTTPETLCIREGM